MTMDSAVDRLAAQWQSCGLAPGDTVLLHSDIRRTLWRLRGQGISSVDHILESFLRAIGTGGTLLLPFFNFDFTTGTQFDIRHTPSQMGALTEAARRRPSIIRTGHPIYSFGIIGRRADEFLGVENVSGYGPDSPFAMLLERGGRIAALDLPDQDCMTFYHFVEETLAVPYRYHKSFEGAYTGLDGLTVKRTFGLYVRDIERGVVTALGGMEELLWSKSLYRGDRPLQNAGLRVIDASDIFASTANVIQSGLAEGMLYKIERPG